MTLNSDRDYQEEFADACAKFIEEAFLDLTISNRIEISKFTKYLLDNYNANQIEIPSQWILDLIYCILANYSQLVDKYIDWLNDTDKKLDKMHQSLQDKK